MVTVPKTENRGKQEICAVNVIKIIMFNMMAIFQYDNQEDEDH